MESIRDEDSSFRLITIMCTKIFYIDYLFMTLSQILPREVNPKAAMSVRKSSAQRALQFALSNAASYVPHRLTDPSDLP